MAVPGLPQSVLLDVVSAQLVMFCFLLSFTWEPYLKGNALPKTSSPGTSGSLSGPSPGGFCWML